jgi:hypothetical protein
MELSRRNFLQTAGVAALVITGGRLGAFGQQKSGGLFPLPAEVYSEPIFSLTARQAEALVGTTFTVTLSSGRTVRLTLTHVNPIQREKNTLRGYYGESFSMVFESQQRVSLAQGSYRISGGELDMTSVLLVPTGLDRKQYELMVNHVTS